MFPAPSPNSQVILQQLQSGGATPSTLDFHRTALNVARKNGVNAPTSNPQETDQLLQQSTNMNVSKSASHADPFAHHDATDAANGLFMLAKGAQVNSNQFNVTSSQSISSHIPTHDSSANAARLRNGNAHAPEANGDMSDSTGEQVKLSGRGKGKKNASSKTSNAASGRRKADDTPTKGQSKKSKGNNGLVNVDPHLDNLDSDDQEETKAPQSESNPKKMTDEEKRKNFLERNR
jgi:ATF/CREB family transcription factor